MRRTAAVGRVGHHGADAAVGGGGGGRVGLRPEHRDHLARHGAADGVVLGPRDQGGPHESVVRGQAGRQVAHDCGRGRPPTRNISYSLTFA